MCGRTAQTIRAVMAASSSLGSNASCRGNSPVDNIGRRVRTDDDRPVGRDNSSASTTDNQEVGAHSEYGEDGTYPWHDNFNLSPGHDAVVFTLDRSSDDSPLLKMDRKKWGLVSRGGTGKAPLPEGPSKHFANLMFNARSDTLFSKPTFAKLLNERKTCLVAVDGFFEWKTDPLGGGKGKKQPYFVFRRDNEKEDVINDQQQSTQSMYGNRPYLLMAGLWTSVPTGYSPPQPATLDTFTILTTEVCDPLSWLHSRMPVCIWDEDLAWKWLQEPSQKVLQQIDNESHRTKEYLIQWHAVTTEMNSTRYRSPDSIKALPKPKSIKSFFSPASKSTKDQNQTTTSNSGTKKDNNVGSKFGRATTLPNKAKRPAPSSTEKKPSQNKRTKQATPDAKKKGTITSFFAPKQS